MAFVQLQDAFGGQAQDTGGAPSGPTFTPLTNLFGQFPNAGGGAPSPAAQTSSVPAPQDQTLQPPTGQPSTTPRSLAGQPPASQPSGDVTLGNTIGQANSLVQQAGKLGETFDPGVTKNLGGTGLNLSDVGGPLSLASGVLKDNPFQMVGGGLSTLGTAFRLADMPEVSATLGALGGPLSLAQGVMNKDPMGIASGLLSTYGGVSSAVEALGGTALPSLGAAAISAFANAAPEVASAIASAFGGTAAAAASEAALAAGATAAEAAGAALSASLGAISGAAAPVIMAITSYLSNAEEKRARESGRVNNPIAGQLYSNATAGVAAATKSNDDLIRQYGSLDKTPTQALSASLGGQLSGLLGYYATAQGPAGPVRASSSVTGMFGRQGLGNAADYTAKGNAVQDNIGNAVNSLLKRGVSYEDLGKTQIPNGNAWGGGDLDMSEPSPTYYQAKKGKFDDEANQIVLKAVQATPGASWEEFAGPDTIGDMLFTASLGSTLSEPDSVSHQGGLYTAMFGGPIFAALARMGAGGPELQQQIKDHFDPWALARTWPPQAIMQIMREGKAALDWQRSQLGGPSPGGGDAGDAGDDGGDDGGGASGGDGDGGAGGDGGGGE